MTKNNLTNNNHVYIRTRGTIRATPTTAPLQGAHPQQSTPETQGSPPSVGGRGQEVVQMIHIILAITLCFLAFILWVELTALHNRLENFTAEIDQLFGHADRIYRGERGWRKGERICKQLI